MLELFVRARRGGNRSQFPGWQIADLFDRMIGDIRQDVAQIAFGSMALILADSVKVERTAVEASRKSLPVRVLPGIAYLLAVNS